MMDNSGVKGKGRNMRVCIVRILQNFCLVGLFVDPGKLEEKEKRTD